VPGPTPQMTSFCKHSNLAFRSWQVVLLVPPSNRRVEADKKAVLRGPRVRRGRALSRGQATARPSPQAVSAHSGYDRSAKNGDTRYACFHDANNQDWSPCLACMLHCGGRINLYPVERHGSYQNPAYSWQLGSKMDGTRLSYG
jgi:hypothetical protein